MIIQHNTRVHDQIVHYAQKHSDWCSVSVQEQERRQLRRDFTTLTSGFFAHPFDQSNPIAAAAMAARSRLLERIEPRISSEPDDQGNASDHAGGSVTQHTPIQRLYTASQAEVQPEGSAHAHDAHEHARKVYGGFLITKSALLPGSALQICLKV